MEVVLPAPAGALTGCTSQGEAAMDSTARFWSADNRELATSIAHRSVW
jgi:hypothetical protein